MRPRQPSASVTQASGASRAPAFSPALTCCLAQRAQSSPSDGAPPRQGLGPPRRSRQSTIACAGPDDQPARRPAGGRAARLRGWPRRERHPRQKYPFISRIHADPRTARARVRRAEPCSVSWHSTARRSAASSRRAAAPIFGHKANTTDFVYGCKRQAGGLQLHRAPSRRRAPAGRRSSSCTTAARRPRHVVHGADRRAPSPTRMRRSRPASCRSSRASTRASTSGRARSSRSNLGGNGTRVSGEHTVAKNERRQLHEERRLRPLRPVCVRGAPRGGAGGHRARLRGDVDGAAASSCTTG